MDEDQFKVVAWQARFSKCPHCYRSLSIISNSRVSKNESVKKMMEDLNFHLNKICRAPEKKKKITNFDIRLEKKGISIYGATYTTYSWENNRIIC
jgi:hypothetical protein